MTDLREWEIDDDAPPRYLTIDEAHAAYREAYGDRDPDEVMAEIYAAQEAEFANPWHDESGKFAPKGAGSTSSGTDYLSADETKALFDWGWNERPTRDEEHVLLDFQAEAFRDINRDVVQFRELAEAAGLDMNAFHKKRASKRSEPSWAMERAWDKRNVPLPRDATLMRGESSRSAPLEPLEIGQTIRPRGYMSTTSSERTANDFVDGWGHGIGMLTPADRPPPEHRRAMRIHAPAGTPVMTARRDESELLLHHATNLRVTGISDMDGVEVVDLEVVP